MNKDTKQQQNDGSYEQEFQLGLDNFRQKKLREAIQHWELAANVDQQQSEVFSVLGSAYKMLNDFSKSCEALRQAYHLEPDNFKYLNNYGIILFEQGRLTEAINILQRGLNMYPDNYELLNDIGVMHFHLKDYTLAEDFFLRALELNGKYFEARINLGHVYIQILEKDKALQTLEILRTFTNREVETLEFENQLTVLEEGAPLKAGVDLELAGQKLCIKPLSILEDFATGISRTEIDISIVVPIMNERENLPILHRKLNDVLTILGKSYEIILIDDGSNDGSLKIMTELAREDGHVKVIQFRKNYGQTAALSAGFKYAQGKVIITLDGDLQNDPADIPRLLEKMAEGYDLVNGWRKDRQDKTITRKIPSKIANMIINKLIAGTGIHLHDFGCTLKAYKRGIVKNIRLYGEMHRFIPVFAAWLGVKVAEIPVQHHPRIHGKAKYNLSRVSRVIFDLLVVRFFSDYMTRPIQFFGKLAKKLFGWGTLAIILLTVLRIIFPMPISYDTMLILFGILSVSCFQIVLLGLLGE
ncbi:MAG: glycosyltransferase, partial [Candidatus Cloacimonetes bacterium]|nr:glycosyltransferase [Candidatus Cloacimonadota bacterium]